MKFLVYIGTAVGTALTGRFIFLQKLRITPEAALSVTEWSAFVIFIVVIGGLGAVAIAVMLIGRRGVWGALRARGIPTLFVTQRTLK